MSNSPLLTEIEETGVTQRNGEFEERTEGRKEERRDR